jgi:hypothetical protein
VSLNYDPGARSQVTDEIVGKARRLGFHVFNVICDEEGARAGDDTGVSFAAVAPFLPRVGEEIQLEDGKVCRVKRVIYVAGAREGFVLVFPNVYATYAPPG